MDHSAFLTLYSIIKTPAQPATWFSVYDSPTQEICCKKIYLSKFGNTSGT